MVKAIRKPLEEITEAIKPYQRVLVLGCGGCVSVCLCGGQKEADQLAALLASESCDTPKQTTSWTIERQCNREFMGSLPDKIKEVDCILSMACGAGVQLVAECFPDKPVFPAVNTVCIGIDRDIGWYEERCRACGECVLSYTGGICPVSRCAKSLFNGPCGGTGRDENCEVDKGIPCAWVEIWKRLSTQNRTDNILSLRPAMAWQNQKQRTLLQPEYEKRYLKSEILSYIHA